MNSTKYENDSDKVETVTLNNGVEIPLMGMGTWPLNGLKLAWLVRKAVKLGYRSFDTSAAYRNEKWLGRGIKICGKPRDSVFVTTKLSDRAVRNGDVQAAFECSLKQLGVDYVDLYLLHWPVREKYLTAWKQMESFYKEGKSRAIGVCNCHQHHLEKLLEISDVVPAINQIELHPLLNQSPLVAFCKEKGIQVEAYSPLARMHEQIINNESILDIARRYNKTLPQVILRWDYQHGVPTVPKSSKPSRLKENISIIDFCLSTEEMKLIDGLNLDCRVRYDPDNCRFTQ